MGDHLRHSAAGHLLHNSGGHLVHECGEVCSQCLPLLTGVNPSSAVLTGWADVDPGPPASCGIINTDPDTLAFTESSESFDHCQWRWDSVSGAASFTLRYYKQAINAAPHFNGTACPGLGVVPGEWTAGFLISGNQSDPSYWFEKTTGFACAGNPSKLSGTHLFGLPCDLGQDCTGTPRITVAA